LNFDGSVLPFKRPAVPDQDIEFDRVSGLGSRKVDPKQQKNILVISKSFLHLQRSNMIDNSDE
jgi:hypothetical protein